KHDASKVCRIQHDIFEQTILSVTHSFSLCLLNRQVDQSLVCGESARVGDRPEENRRYADVSDANRGTFLGDYFLDDISQNEAKSDDHKLSEGPVSKVPNVDAHQDRVDRCRPGDPRVRDEYASA